MYLFDVNGDMLQKKETYSKQEEVFLFDKHNRLNIWRTFEKDTLRKEIFASYDDVYGNIVSRSDSDFVFNYGEYGLSPHALTSIDAPIHGHDKENNYTYTDFKMLESASNGVDFQRRRMKIFKNDSLILTRYYFSDYEEEHYADGRVRKIDYITGPTGLVGVRISTNGTDSLLHAFTDRFGNLVMLVDGDKNIVDRLAYDPWGARRNPDDWTKPDTARHLLPRGYSMHEHLDCLGLINMNARIYEPATCSFLSPDPLIADEGNWLNYNRYLYCLGNPVKFADPTGMEVAGPWNAPLTGKTGVVPQNGGGNFGVVNTYWEYDPSNSCNPVWLVVEGSYNGANNSNDYFVNYATSGNSIYVASVMADHKNAIDWQIANAGAKAMESSWRGIWQAGVNGLQTLSYGLDTWGTVCLIAAPFTEGASLPLSAIFYTAGTVVGVVGDVANTIVLSYYDDNFASGIMTLGISVGFSLLMNRAPKTYKQELTKAAELKAKRLCKSMDEYMDHIDRQMVYFSHSINTMGAVFDKYLDVLNSYIPSIIK